MIMAFTMLESQQASYLYYLLKITVDYCASFEPEKSPRLAAGQYVNERDTLGRQQPQQVNTHVSPQCDRWSQTVVKQQSDCRG